MRDKTRRLEFGKMTFDVAKYTLTIVVIGGLVSERVDLTGMVIGILLGVGLIGLGYQLIPPEEIK